jgi:hypothetical protein
MALHWPGRVGSHYRDNAGSKCCRRRCPLAIISLVGVFHAGMRKCAFCPSTASLTGEHLRSDWVNKLLEGRTHDYVIRQRSYGSKPTEWRDKKLNLKANIACSAYSSGWMSQLDSRAKRALQDIILHNSPVSLLPQVYPTSRHSR